MVTIAFIDMTDKGNTNTVWPVNHWEQPLIGEEEYDYGGFSNGSS